MFRTPQETSMMKLLDVGVIKSKLSQYFIMHPEKMSPLLVGDLKYDDTILTLNSSDGEIDVPLFNIPVLIDTVPQSTNKDDQKFVVDCRGFTARQNDGTIKITKPTQYKTVVTGAYLTDSWFYNGPERFASISKFPVKIFSNWIASTVSRRLNIDEIAQVRFNVILAYYFLCMFENVAPYSAREFLDEDKAYNFAIKISYASGMKNVDVLNIISEIPTMSSLEDLEKAVKEFGGSDRFKLFNPALLYTLLGRTALFGVPADVVQTALEYPPLFYTMVYIAATEKGYNKSAIGSIVQNNRNVEDLKYFCKMVKTFIVEE